MIRLIDALVDFIVRRVGIWILIALLALAAIWGWLT